MSISEDAAGSSVARELYQRWCERRTGGRARDFEHFAQQWPRYESELRRLRAADGGHTPQATAASADAAAEALANLRTVQVSRERYRIDGVLGLGGGGIVLRVVDRALGRELAMKMLRTEFESGDAGTGNRQGLRRLVDEAEVLGKLEHPSIVPVHELGLDERGRVYFTMPRIQGLPLTEVIAHAAAGDGPWPRERVLEVLLKVCDALAYAHEQGVLHRDLKPANVMVGKFGQVYVVDWGLARAREGRTGENATQAPGVTLDGDVLGTPCYMSPEQARGRAEEIDGRTDMYAIGAMLYEFLAGHAPYRDRVPDGNSGDVLQALRAGPPTDLERLAPQASGELIAIARKAMARERDRRYADVASLAEDLRAFMEGRVVAAHGRGGWVQLRKWVLRNRLLAASLVASLAIALAAAVLVLAAEHGRATLAREQADARALASLRERDQALWPARPRNLFAMLIWLEEARDLVSRIPDYRAQLLALRRGAARNSPGASDDLPQIEALTRRITDLRAQIIGLDHDLEDMRLHAGGLGLQQGVKFAREEQQRYAARIVRLQAIVDEHGGWSFADPADALRQAALSNILLDALELADPVDGGIVHMQARVEAVRELESSSLREPQARWIEASASIADELACPSYRGLRLTPQFGLVPVGRDPDSGLWEFVDVATGTVPERDARGQLQLGAEHGIVFVLLPPGEIELGHDSILPVPQVLARVRLDAFFLAKYELTQAQWTRMCGENPSYYRVGTYWPIDAERSPPSGDVITATWSSPVEQVNWYQCVEALQRYGFDLPTEAQWEYGCRAGTQTPWSLGASEAELVGKVNMAESDSPPLPFDGWHIPCPIGTFPANPWGLHEVHGNVSEWVLEPFWTSFRFSLRAGDGLFLAPESRLRTTRGGNHGHDAGAISSGARGERTPAFCDRCVGVRPMRRVAARAED